MRKLSEKEGLSAFRKEWKKTFGKEVSEVIARDYLQFVNMHKKHRAHTGSLAHKGQKGGASVIYSPAAIGYDMVPGTGVVSVPPYATYASYASSGMGSVNQDSVASSCGGPNAFLQPSPALGSNSVGGRRLKKTRRVNKNKQKGGSLTSTFA